MALKGTPGTVPARMAPPTLIDDSRRRNVDIEWVIPTGLAETGGAPITSITLEWRRSATDPWTEVAGLTGTTHQLTNLRLGETVEVRIKAVNRFGASAQWSDVAFNLLAIAPRRIQSVAITDGDQMLSLAWDAPGDNSSPILDYRVRWALVSNPTNWLNPNGADGETATSTSYDITGLVNGSAYRVQVAARNDRGLSRFSPGDDATPGTVPARFPAPTLTPGNRTLIIRWTIPTAAAQTGGAAITGVDVQYRVIAPGITWTLRENVPGIGIQLTGAVLGTRIEARVRPVNRFGHAADWSPISEALIAIAPAKVAAPTLTAAMSRSRPHGAGHASMAARYRITASAGRWRPTRPTGSIRPARMAKPPPAPATTSPACSMKASTVCKSQLATELAWATVLTR